MKRCSTKLKGGRGEGRKGDLTSSHRAPICTASMSRSAMLTPVLTPSPTPSSCGCVTSAPPSHSASVTSPCTSFTWSSVISTRTASSNPSTLNSVRVVGKTRFCRSSVNLPPDPGEFRVKRHEDNHLCGRRLPPPSLSPLYPSHHCTGGVGGEGGRRLPGCDR